MPALLVDKYSWKEIVDKSCNEISKYAHKFNKEEFTKWMLTKEKQSFLFDSLMYYRCFLIKEKLKKKFDYIIALCGSEGIGKSTFSILIACVLYEKDFKSISVCMDAEEFLNILENAGEDDVIIADEGAFFLFSRDANTRSNKIVTKILTIIRQKRLCIIINVVNYFLLDNYLRNHRVNLLIQIKKRGHYRQINKKGIEIITSKGWKTKNVLSVRMPSRNFHDGYWNNRIPETFDITNYELKKKRNMKKAISDARELIISKQPKIKIKKIDIKPDTYDNVKFVKMAKVFKSIGIGKLRDNKKLIKKFNITPKLINKRWYLTPEQAEEMIKKWSNNDLNT